MKDNNEESKKLPWLEILIGIGILIVAFLTPVILGWLIPKENNIPNFTDSNDWIGFFGSYSGSIISGVITLIVLCLTRKDTREIQSENKRLQKKLIGIEEENQYREYRTMFVDFGISDKFNLENSKSVISGNMLLKNSHYDKIAKEVVKYENLKIQSVPALQGESWIDKFGEIINFPYKVIKNIGEKPMINVTIKIGGEWVDKDKKCNDELVFNIDFIEGGKSILMPVFKYEEKLKFIYFNIIEMNVTYEMGMMNKREKADIKLKYSLDKLSVERSMEISKINTSKAENYKYNNYSILD